MDATFTIPYRELARLITVALPSVGTEPMLPVYMQVRLREAHGKIIAEATDRYTLMRVRGESEVPAGLSFGLPATTWRKVLAMFKPPLLDAAVTFELSGESVTIAPAQPKLMPDAPSGASFATTGSGWTDFDGMGLMGGLSKDPAGSAGITPSYLRRVPLGDGNCAVVANGPNKPAYILGEDWMLLIMARRDVDTAGRIKSWAVSE